MVPTPLAIPEAGAPFLSRSLREGWASAGHGSNALSRPIRVDSPAARITPAIPIGYPVGAPPPRGFRRVEPVLLLCHFPVQQLAQIAPRAAHADVESPELRIH